MAGRKTLRAEQLEASRAIHREADRLASESVPARAREQRDAFILAADEAVSIIETLARGGV